MAIYISKHVVITSSSYYKDMVGKIQDYFIDQSIIFNFKNIKDIIFYQVKFETPPENFSKTSYFTESEFKIL
jgi:hypothetical protein